MKYLYIIGNEVENICKIGISGNPSKRLKQLQTGCPYKLTILAVVGSFDYESEKNLHNRYKDYRLNGEWFRIKGEIRTIIEQSTPKEIKVSKTIKEVPPITDIHCYHISKKKRKRKNVAKYLNNVYNHR